MVKTSKRINIEVINVPVIKPLDMETVINSVKKTNYAITVENHSVIGGLGSAICETLSGHYPCKVYRIGIHDEFGQSGTAKELMAYYGLNSEKLTEKIFSLIDLPSSLIVIQNIFCFTYTLLQKRKKSI